MNFDSLNPAMDYIQKNNLIEKGDRVGIAVSGGSDSMALLHFLVKAKKTLGCHIIAININHNMRPASRKDSKFVSDYCKVHDIEFIGFNVDVPTFATTYKLSPEQAARIKRYECFDLAIKKLNLDKVALAHHASDQAETILLHIFRGSGISGASGMDFKRGPYIRPFLETEKADIIAYLYRNQIPHVEDETNFDSKYARSFLRNEIIPLLKREWRNVEKNIIDFGTNCRSDNDYINSVVSDRTLNQAENNIRIPLNNFAYHDAFVSRVILKALGDIGMRENIEKKHIDLICDLARNGENGARIDLPNFLYAVKEYEHITIVKKPNTGHKQTAMSFKPGKTPFSGYGTIMVSKTISYKPARERGLMVIDADKLPKGAKWRTRKDGDVFTKFGGGTKPLGKYLIDIKVPARLRATLPVLAVGNEVYAIAGIEISDKVKTDMNTAEAYVIEFVKD